MSRKCCSTNLHFQEKLTSCCDLVILILKIRPFGGPLLNSFIILKYLTGNSQRGRLTAETDSYINFDKERNNGVAKF